MWDVLAWNLKTIHISFHFRMSCRFYVHMSAGSQIHRSRHQAKLNLLWPLLDVAHVVAAHRACSHVADERKEFILWQDRTQRCIRNREAQIFYIKRAFQMLSMCLAHNSLPGPSLTRGPDGGSRPPSLSAAERPPSDTSMESMSSRWEKIQSRARSRTLLCRTTRKFSMALCRDTNKRKIYIYIFFFFTFIDLWFQISASIYLYKAQTLAVASLQLRPDHRRDSESRWDHKQLDCLFQFSRKHSAADDSATTLEY